jgi:hypothetical protein
MRRFSKVYPSERRMFLPKPPVWVADRDLWEKISKKVGGYGRGYGWSLTEATRIYREEGGAIRRAPARFDEYKKASRMRARIARLGVLRAEREERLGAPRRDPRRGGSDIWDELVGGFAGPEEIAHGLNIMLETAELIFEAISTIPRAKIEKAQQKYERRMGLEESDRPVSPHLRMGAKGAGRVSEAVGSIRRRMGMAMGDMKAFNQRFFKDVPQGKDIKWYGNKGVLALPGGKNAEIKLNDSHISRHYDEYVVSIIDATGHGKITSHRFPFEQYLDPSKRKDKRGDYEGFYAWQYSSAQPLEWYIAVPSDDNVRAMAEEIMSFIKDYTV